MYCGWSLGHETVFCTALQSLASPVPCSCFPSPLQLLPQSLAVASPVPCSCFPSPLQLLPQSLTSLVPCSCFPSPLQLLPQSLAVASPVPCSCFPSPLQLLPQSLASPVSCFLSFLLVSVQLVFNTISSSCGLCMRRQFGMVFTILKPCNIYAEFY